MVREEYSNLYLYPSLKKWSHKYIEHTSMLRDVIWQHTIIKQIYKASRLFLIITAPKYIIKFGSHVIGLFLGWLIFVFLLDNFHYDGDISSWHLASHALGGEGGDIDISRCKLSTNLSKLSSHEFINCTWKYEKLCSILISTRHLVWKLDSN